jgi:hypothetical protein
VLERVPDESSEELEVGFESSEALSERECARTWRAP